MTQREDDAEARKISHILRLHGTALVNQGAIMNALIALLMDSGHPEAQLHVENLSNRIKRTGEQL